ncbi:MAG: hypothetical protein PHG89_06305 [Gallionella sp.]|nr:hypothetical protein [Gallionella sp.]
MSSLPPPVIAPETGPEVKALAGVQRAKPVQVRTLPLLVVQPHARHEAPPEAAENEEKRHDSHVHGERRIYCRRIEHLPILVELRSGINRRRHNQRASDITEHIDVKV